MRAWPIGFVALIACSSGEREAAYAPPAPAREPDAAPASDPLASLYADDPELPARVAEIAAHDDVATRRSAAEQLVSFARDVSSEEWRDGRRHEVAVELGTHRQPIAGEEIEAALDRYQTKHLRVLFLAMATLRERVIVDYAFEVAEDDREPLRWRQLALGVLLKHVDRDEVELYVRRTAVADRLAALEAGG